MTPRGVLARLTRRVLDRDTTERLLSGRMHPDDAPPGYSGAASVVRALVAAPRPDELAAQRVAVAIAMRSIVQGAGASTTGFERAKRSWARRSGVLAVAMALLTTGVAAAAMPEQTRDVVADAVGDAMSLLGLGPPEASAGGAFVHATLGEPSAKGLGIAEIATDPSLFGVHKGQRVSRQSSDGASHAGDQGAGDEGAGGAQGYPPTPSIPDLPDPVEHATDPSQPSTGRASDDGAEAAAATSDAGAEADASPPP